MIFTASDILIDGDVHIVRHHRHRTLNYDSILPFITLKTRGD